MSRGRPKSKSSDLLIEKFELFRDDIIQNEKVVPPSSEIWKNFGLKDITNKAIYSAALRWFDKQCDSKDKEYLQCEPEISMEISLVSKDDSSLNSTEEKEISAKKFSIVLSNDVWKTIEPCSTQYRRKIDETHKSGVRTYYILQPGVWSNVIADKIADSRADIICNFTFERSKVYQNGEFYVDITAKCATCKAVLHGKNWRF